MGELLNTEVNRRQFLEGALAATFLAATGLGTYELGTFAEYDPTNPVIDIVYRKIPGMTGNAFTIHLTDIHYGGEEAYVNALVLEQVVFKINKTLYMLGATPDNTALIMTGDWVSKIEEPRFHIRSPRGGETDPKDIPVMLEILKDLNADHLIGALGNHDIKYAYRRELVKRILQSGIHLLDTESGFYTGDFAIPIIVLDDYTEFKPLYTPTSVAEIAKKINSRRGPKIIGTHNASVVDLTRLGLLVDGETEFDCGHTHGGHTKHKRLIQHALSDRYKSRFVRGLYQYGKNIVQMTDGLGQHPQAAFRQIPAGVRINAYSG